MGPPLADKRPLTEWEASATPMGPGGVRSREGASMYPIVHLVDDDPDVLRALSRALWSDGYTVVPSSSGEEFLEVYQPGDAGCVILDLMMPGKSGMDVQAELARRGHVPPIIYITGMVEIACAVKIMKSGAVDLLTKPVELDLLIEAVSQGLARDARIRNLLSRCAVARARLESLSSREREVLQYVSNGDSNAVVAEALGITVRTVKVHREHIRFKLEVRTTPELIHLLTEGGFSSMPALPRDRRCGRTGTRRRNW